MALLASQGCMGPGQRKVSAVVIEVDMIPTGGVMTGRAVRAKFSTVIVILLMTGIAIHWRAFELLIYMTCLTGNFRMPALQFERCQIVIKFCRRPSLRCVAIRATEAKTTFMRLIFSMARITILQCYLEIAKPPCIDMTLHTSQSYMLAGNFEQKPIVIEIFSKAIQAIMAIQAS